MNISCGIDIIEIDRIKDSIENIGERFIEKVFTDNSLFRVSRIFFNPNQDFLSIKISLNRPFCSKKDDFFGFFISNAVRKLLNNNEINNFIVCSNDEIIIETVYSKGIGAVEYNITYCHKKKGGNNNSALVCGRGKVEILKYFPTRCKTCADNQTNIYKSQT